MQVDAALLCETMHDKTCKRYTHRNRADLYEAAAEHGGSVQRTVTVLFLQIGKAVSDSVLPQAAIDGPVIFLYDAELPPEQSER